MGLRILKFSQIPDQLRYPAGYFGKISSVHSSIISIVLTRSEYTVQELKQIIQLINTVSYKMLNNESVDGIVTNDGNLNYDCLLPDMEVRDFLNAKMMYVPFKDIQWQQDNISKISQVEAFGNPISQVSQVQSTDVKPEIQSKSLVEAVSIAPVAKEPVKPMLDPVMKPTDKAELYLKPPVVPTFSIANPTVVDDGANKLVIYQSLPTIPTCQNEISITTDVNMMLGSDLLRLFPNQIIQTRSAIMYESLSDIELLPKIGLILPIEGYTREQLVDNIIKYPHIYKLTRMIDDKLSSFYTSIEIDGELHKISEVWKTLPESSVIPYNSDFVKEYVVRRYLLERDIKKVQHVYPMYGSLDPFLTLFMPASDYAEFGYKNAEQLARSCVESRVAFKRSRNPILRRSVHV